MLQQTSLSAIDNSTTHLPGMLRTAVVRLAPVFGLLFFLQVPALKDLFKYLPYPIAISTGIFIATGVLYYCLLHTNIGRPLLQSKWYAVGVILLIAVANAVVYPRANALGAVGGGSNADDAIIETINSLLHGHGLYEVDIGMPVSPGPGWLLLNIPFAFRTTFFLLTPAYCAIMALFCRYYTGGHISGNRILTVFLSSLLFWDLSVVGYDHFTIGVTIMLLVLIVNRMQLTVRKTVFAAVVAGFVATARIVFLPLGFLLGALLWRRDHRLGVLFGGISFGCTLFLHGVFFVTSTVYQPLHLFGKVNNDTGVMPIVIAGVMGLAIGVPLLFKKTTAFGSWAAATLFWFAVPLVFAAWGELHAYSYRLAAWEGAHYLIVLAPLAAAASLLRFPCVEKHSKIQ